MDDIIERWINVKDQDNYEVSNLGKVRNKTTGKILRYQMNKTHNGYARVTMSGKRDYVHRIVAGSFYDCDLEDMQVNHLDGNKLNNSLGNLEVCTRKENMAHMVEHDLRHHSMVSVVRCRDCKHRYDYEHCAGQDDSFYCAFGKSKRPEMPI